MTPRTRIDVKFLVEDGGVWVERRSRLIETAVKECDLDSFMCDVTIALYEELEAVTNGWEVLTPEDLAMEA